MPQRQLKLPKYIVCLEDTFLPVVPKPHQCYVEYPLVLPPQGCLVVREENGEEIWEAALIVVPADAPVSAEVHDCAYTLGVGLINSSFKTVMKRPFSEAMLSLWEGSWEKYPFKNNSKDNSEDSLVHDIRSFIADPNTNKLSARDVTEKVEELCERHCFVQNSWTPIILNHSRFPYRCEIKWEIARAWKNYNLRQYTLEGCAKKLSELGLYDGGLSESAKNTFGHFLSRHGLRPKYHINARRQW